MHTDLPLKRLTILRAADLLSLLGVPADEVEEVVVRDLPMQKRALDTILRIRSPQGQIYLHILEWQGYYDTAALWRLTGYMSLVGQENPHTTIIGTIIYLRPTDDVGETVTMAVDGQVLHHWSVRSIRLWEQDAQTALASGNLALATLSPLMRGATTALVTQAAHIVLNQAPAPQQADLLSILGVFAAPLLEPAAFIRLVTKEKLMSSELIEYLTRDIIAEQEAKWQARLDTERQALELEAKQQALALEAERQARLQTEQETLEAMVQLRFPEAPMRLSFLIRQIHAVEPLQALRAQVPIVADLATLEQQIRDASG